LKRLSAIVLELRHRRRLRLFHRLLLRHRRLLLCLQLLCLLLATLYPQLKPWTFRVKWLKELPVFQTQVLKPLWTSNSRAPRRKKKRKSKTG
jgi:hypothetical protein